MKKKKDLRDNKILTKQHVYMIKKKQNLRDKKNIFIFTYDSTRIRVPLVLKLKKIHTLLLNHVGSREKMKQMLKESYGSLYSKLIFFFNKDAPTLYKHEKNLLPDMV